MSDRPARPSARKPGIAFLGSPENEEEAGHWETLLTEAGVHCLIRSRDALSHPAPDLSVEPGEYEVYVPATAIKHARQVLLESLDADRQARITVGERELPVTWLLLMLIAPVLVLLIVLIVVLA
jgi:hypothetical protein